MGHLDLFDRVDLAFLPGDVDGNRTTHTADHDLLLEYHGGTPYPNIEVVDMNRDTAFSVQDKTRLEQLLAGTRSSQAWNNVSLPQRP